MQERLILRDIELQRHRVKINRKCHRPVGVGRAAGPLAADHEIALGEQENFISRRGGAQPGIHTAEDASRRRRQRIRHGARTSSPEINIRRCDHWSATLRPAHQSNRREHRRQRSERLIVCATNRLNANRLVVSQQYPGHGKTSRRKDVLRRSTARDRELNNEISEFFLPEQRKRISNTQRVDRRIGEIGAGRLAVAAITISRSRQHRLIRRNREDACEFSRRHIASGRDLDRDIVQPVVARCEERLDRHRRFVVEKDDELFADVNQRHLLVRDRREIDFCLLVVAKIDDHRLIRQRLGQLVNPRWCLIICG